MIQKILAIFIKNWMLVMANKKKPMGDLAFPFLLCIIYYYYKQYQKQISIATIILKFTLTFTVAMLNNSTIRQLVTLFILQRQQKHRQYQMIMGLSFKQYTIANFLYMLIYTIVVSLPFLIIVNYYNFGWINFYCFFVFLLSSNSMALMLTAFFNDQKIAVQVIGVLFSFTSFLPLVYDRNSHNFTNILGSIFPNSSFSLATFSEDLSTKFEFSTISLALVPVYLFIYWMVEYRQQFLLKIRKIFSSSQQCEDRLMQQNQSESQSVYQQSNQDDNNLIEQPLGISINNVIKSYGNIMAVNKFSLKVEKSKIIGLLGRNGAGKTTLVDMITKVTKPTSGNIIIQISKNKSNSNSNSNNRPKLGICYQKQILYEELTAMTHLQVYAKIKKIQNQQQYIDKLVQKVGFTEHVHKKVNQLSGGNKRKLSVSLALLGNPQIIIFDEPTSGLDPLSRRNIWSIIQGLKQSKTTVILTTHHLDEADELSDIICVIEKGEKLIEDTPESIKQKYGQGYYLTLYFDQLQQKADNINQCSNIIKKLLPTSKILQQESDCLKYLIQPHIDFKLLSQVIQNLQKITGVRISLERNSLQHSFITIINENSNNHQKAKKQNSIRRSLLSISQFSQIKAMFLKNVLCFYRKFYSSYCLTLIIFIVVITIDLFLLQKMSKTLPIEEQLPNYKSNLGKNQQNQNSFGISSLVIMQIFILMTSAFISIPMTDKQTKITQLLRTRGVNRFNYWFGSYLFDILYFLFVFVMMRIFLPNIFSDCSFILIFSSGTAIILYAYSITLIFSKKKTANTWFTLLNFFFYTLIMPFLMTDNGFKGTFYANIVYVKYIYPYFDLAKFLIRHDTTFNNISTMLPQSQQTSYVQYSILFYFCIIVIFEGKILQRIFNKKINLTCTDKLLMENVSKNYKNVQALKNVSYSINNERVALLGHNGAGKSTTFGLLSSQLNQTYGDVYLEGKITEFHQQTLKSTGVCFQDDTLWQCLKSKDIVQIFSTLLRITDTQSEKKQLLDSLQFDHENWNKKFEHLSGGNKRKLCMTVCLMGQPETRLLDQCSTGLDPISRLLMVKTIKKQQQGCTLFTTHSIPEAEDLCSRAIIMKQGRVQEDDKIYRLKQKYYDCFWVYLTLNSQSVFLSIAKQIFEDTYHPNSLNYIQRKNLVEVSKKETKLSQLMKHMNLSREQGIIQDFKIDEPKLEDVYIKITGPAEQQQEYFN